MPKVAQKFINFYTLAEVHFVKGPTEMLKNGQKFIKFFTMVE